MLALGGGPLLYFACFHIVDRPADDGGDGEPASSPAADPTLLRGGGHHGGAVSVPRDGAQAERAGVLPAVGVPLVWRLVVVPVPADGLLAVVVRGGHHQGRRWAAAGGALFPEDDAPALRRRGGGGGGVRVLPERHRGGVGGEGAPVPAPLPPRLPGPLGPGAAGGGDVPALPRAAPGGVLLLR